MPMIITPESETGKELAKWNKPYVYHKFPKMLYRAQRRPDGIVSVCEVDDAVFPRDRQGDPRPGVAEAFNTTCQLTVGDAKNTDEQNERLLSEALEKGWRPTPAEALAFFESREVKKADVTAHRHYEDRGMSEQALAEAAAVDAASPEHVPALTEKPLAKRRGRPPKNAAA